MADHFRGVIPVLSCVLLVWASPLASGQSTWHIDDDAPNDPGPGDPTVSDPDENGSAEHPFDAIQEGIDAAVAGDEVLIADGVYTGAGNRDLNFKGKDITVRSDNGAENCVIDCEGDPDNFHRGFLFENGETHEASIRGLTITNGVFSGGDGGGAVRCEPDSSATIVDCRFIGNTASYGGGLYGSATVVSCDFVGNDGIGGGAYARDGATFTDCTFTHNTGFSYSGSGAEVYGNVTFSRCAFTQNNGLSCGLRCVGAVAVNDCTISENEGLGLLCATGTQVTNSVITSNGGAGYGGILCFEDVTLSNCLIAWNTSYYGGGIRSEEGSNVTIRNCTIMNNGAEGGGGGVYCHSGSNTIIENCILSNNSVLSAGGGLYREGNADVTLVNCVVANSTRWGGGGGGGLNGGTGNLIVKNSILWGNGREISLDGRTADVSYCNVEGGEAGVELNPVAVFTCGVGNIDADPLFADADGPDDDPLT